MSSITLTRCAACKYLRRRCPSDCIFLPYFPSNDPQRFACVHRIYGASNVGKILQQLPIHLRGEAAESMYYEALCRIEEPVYGCVGIVSLLHEEICNAQSELAKAQAQLSFLNSDQKPQPQPQPQPQPPIKEDVIPVTPPLLPEENTAPESESPYDAPSTPWFQ